MHLQYRQGDMLGVRVEIVPDGAVELEHELLSDGPEGLHRVTIEDRLGQNAEFTSVNPEEYADETVIVRPDGLSNIPSHRDFTFRKALVLHTGKVTGHMHFFPRFKGKAWRVEGQEGIYAKLDEEQTMLHNEHGPLTVAPGLYLFVRQRVWNGDPAVDPIDAIKGLAEARIRTVQELARLLMTDVDTICNSARQCLVYTDGASEYPLSSEDANKIAAYVIKMKRKLPERYFAPVTPSFIAGEFGVEAAVVIAVVKANQWFEGFLTPDTELDMDTATRVAKALNAVHLPANDPGMDWRNAVSFLED